MRKLLLIIPLCLSGCIGNNFKTDVAKQQRETDITGIIGESKVKQKEFKPNEVRIEASGNALVRVNIPEPQMEEFEALNKGNVADRSTLDYSFKGVQDFVSAWYYLIIAFSLIVFVIAFRMIKSYISQLGISGGLKLGASWLSEIADFRKVNNNEKINSVLAEIEARLERKFGKLKEKSKYKG